MTTLVLGQTVVTANASETLNKSDMNAALERHRNGDWGDLDKGDKTVNDEALATGEDRILSAYNDSNGTRFWIITEWDRSVTTILLPEDY
jgi:hypothetical protein